MKEEKHFWKVQNACPLMSGADLENKESCKLFSWSANQPDLDIVNHALICSLKLAEERIKALENELEQLKSTGQLV